MLPVNSYAGCVGSLHRLSLVARVVAFDALLVGRLSSVGFAGSVPLRALPLSFPPRFL